MIRTLWELYTVLFKVGLCTFGGGIAMLPILERELAEKRNWTNSTELLDWFAIGQSTPGIIAVNVATFIGEKRAGIIGAIVATAGMVSPSVIIITIIAKFISTFSSIGWVQSALLGINVAVAALLTNAVWKFAKKSVKNMHTFMLFLLAFVAIYFFKVSTVWIIIASVLIGVYGAGIQGEYSLKPVIAFTAILVVLVSGYFLARNVQKISKNDQETQVQTEETILEQSELLPAEHAELLPADESGMARTPGEHVRAIPILTLFLIFFYVGLVTIGGGLVSITIMQQVIVEKYALISLDMFYNMVAISESTPGPIGINMATYIGTELYGIGGGIITTCGQVLPSLICILIIAKCFSRFADRAGVKAAFSTLRPAVTGVIAVAAVNVFVLAVLSVPESLSSLADAQTWRTILHIPQFLFYIAGTVVLFKTKLHPIFLVCAGGLFGAALAQFGLL